MKKIGFIDYFLHEWHADNYPQWIEKATGGSMKVAYAYGMIEPAQGLGNAEWCAGKQIELLPSIEQVVDKSDYLVVLSPDHPEMHEELSRLALQSGKPTYVDKTFAPDRRTALRIFETAHKHNTPVYSSSALRFAPEYTELDRQGIESVISIGPGTFEHYAVHQIEPIVALMGCRPTRVMYAGTVQTPALLIGFEDGRQAAIHHLGWGCPFQMTVGYGEGGVKTVAAKSDYFAAFIRELTAFFETGQPPVPPSDTIAIISIIEYGRKAAQTPYQWLELPQH